MENLLYTILCIMFVFDKGIIIPEEVNILLGNLLSSEKDIFEGEWVESVFVELHFLQWSILF